MSKKKSPCRRAAEDPTGTYKYDRESGRLVKVSSGVPGLKKGAAPEPEPGPCGRSACGSRPCSYSS